ncbi:YihY/virulence factor BrkB family protein [Streptomyces pactum]|uniref:YihY/virulence factor BrkB family protein n=1 Tax=Streptomyces pactum TaxID=68249 RepID=A0ABS0NTZ4_9ACTN|nr:YihY/virulence factor BrkB family protein [Streptomyces pactum]MBH5338677.1 YihY/virulence factor BrkB family protein [Streptomyces pactum]
MSGVYRPQGDDRPDDDRPDRGGTAGPGPREDDGRSRATEPGRDGVTGPGGRGTEEPGRHETADDRDGAPEGPTDLPRRSWKDAAKRTVKEFKADNLTDWAAALTYYGVLSVVPAMLALVSILGLLGKSSVQSLLDNLKGLAPGAVRDTLSTMLEQLEKNQGKAGIALAISLLVALWSASGYIAAFMRASNAVYDIGEGRPVWKTLPTRLGVTVVVLVLLALIAVGVVFTGTLARRTGEVLGLGDTAITVWNIAKWPVMLLLFSLVIALLYWACPNVRRGFTWVTPGSLFAVVIWVIASAGFALYVATFGSYDKTYGSLAGIVVFLVWLWISNIAILFGLEFDAELERARAIEAGHPADEEPYVEPRDDRKL